MKKVIFVVVVVILAGFSAQAQSTKFGLKAGMTSSNVKATGDGESETADSKIGFYAGVMAEIGISENFAIQPELYYSLLGAKYDEDDYKERDHLSYLNLPILLKYKNQGFSAFVGPQFSYLISAKSKWEEMGESGNDDIKDFFKSTDVSGVIGAAYTLPNGFGFDARYQLGFGNIAKMEEDEGDFKIKNNAIMVGLHYYFSR